MRASEKINYLQENHFSEWLQTRRKVSDEISDSQSMFCVCGKLATGLHESSCRKLASRINTVTVNRLNHLIAKSK